MNYKTRQKKVPAHKPPPSAPKAHVCHERGHQIVPETAPGTMRILWEANYTDQSTPCTLPESLWQVTVLVHQRIACLLRIARNTIFGLLSFVFCSFLHPLTGHRIDRVCSSLSNWKQMQINDSKESKEEEKNGVHINEECKSNMAALSAYILRISGNFLL
jgi:hypothetical protein